MVVSTCIMRWSLIISCCSVAIFFMNVSYSAEMVAGDESEDESWTSFAHPDLFIRQHLFNLKFPPPPMPPSLTTICWFFSPSSFREGSDHFSALVMVHFLFFKFVTFFLYISFLNEWVSGDLITDSNFVVTKFSSSPPTQTEDLLIFTSCLKSNLKNAGFKSLGDP